jgi:UDPglucose 6-dehydrogenase
MKLIIAGYGYVGKAYHAILKESWDVEIHDPRLGYVADFDKVCQGIICCVSTPSNADGSCDGSSVIDVVNQARQLDNIPVLVKSTIDLQVWDQIKEFNTTFSPEFLRAETAVKDLCNAETHYLAKGDTNFWATILIEALGKINVNTKNSPEELILIKYLRNSFLATKVSFFNQVYDLCEASGVNYTSVANGVSVDKRFGESHTSITTERGFGGHCFPKDTLALTKLAEQHGVDLSLIECAIKYNYQVRKDNV